MSAAHATLVMFFIFSVGNLLIWDFYVTLVSFTAVSRSTGGLAPSLTIGSPELKIAGLLEPVISVRKKKALSPDTPRAPLKNVENIMGGYSFLGVLPARRSVCLTDPSCKSPSVAHYSSRPPTPAAYACTTRSQRAMPLPAGVRGPV